VRFPPDEFLGTVFPREVSLKTIGSIVIPHTFVEVLSLADVERATGIFQHVHAEHIGSQSQLNKTGSIMLPVSIDKLAPHTGHSAQLVRRADGGDENNL
jgi:hypothetical protein